MSSQKQKSYCFECDQLLLKTYYCHRCESTHFKENFDNWTSENEKIDQFIRNTQLEARECTEYLEWIPFSSFINVSRYEASEVGTVFTANWDKGPADCWDPDEIQFVRKRELTKVALISLGNDPIELLKELDLQYRARKNNALILRLFGVTKEIITGVYMIVAETAEWDLRHYVSHHFLRLTWPQKLAILHTIAVGLANLRADKQDRLKNDYITRSHFEVQVSELGLGDCNDFIPVIGYQRFDLLPFFAPEILLGVDIKQTSKSEVYMFGMLMWEFATNRPPFYDTLRDASLVSEIVKGNRPVIPKGIPDCYVQLMQDCWHSEPSYRPDMDEVARDVGEWHLYSREYEAFVQAERQRYQEIKSRGLNPDGKMLIPPKVHPQAIYTSRLFKFPVLPKSRKKSQAITAAYLERQERQDLECMWVRDESFFMSKTLIQRRTSCPQMEEELVDEDLMREYHDLSIDVET